MKENYQNNQKEHWAKEKSALGFNGISQGCWVE